MRLRMLVIGGALWSLLWPTSSFAGDEPRYEVIDLGALAGGESTALAISDAGYVVGHSTTGAGEGSAMTHAVLWLPVRTDPFGFVLRDLGTFDGVGSSVATGVNDSLQVSGRSQRDEIGPSGSLINRGFLWEGDEMTEIGTLSPGFTGSAAAALNSMGEVVAVEGSSFSCEPMIWLPGPAYGLPAGLHPIPKPGDFGDGVVAQINDSGEVAGTRKSACDLVGTDSAFIWLPNGAYGLPAGAHELIPGVEGSMETQAEAINDLGQVAGIISDFSSSTQELFVWQAGASTVLGNPPGDMFTQPKGINDSAQIVGATSESFSTASSAFLWENGQFLDLNTLIPVNSGWLLTTAFAINNDGWIVGEGSRNGLNRAFLLKPPSPIQDIPTLSSLGLAMLSLLLVAGGLVVMRRSREGLRPNGH